jgi:prepilin-type N-terminal cleavage/methylation domain-containing protein
MDFALIYVKGGNMRRKQGFTLIELLIVIAIICILAGMLLAGIAVAIKRAKIASTRMLIKNMELAVKAYYNDWGKYPPDADWTNDPTPEIAVKEMYRALYTDGDTFSRAGAPGWGPYITMELRYMEESSREDSDGDGNIDAATIIDSWGHTIYYDNNWTEGTEYKGNNPPTTYGNHLDTAEDDEFDSIYTDVNATFDLFSAGPDGVYDTADDISNWAD